METAFRMQSAAGEAFDVRREPLRVREMYGAGEFARGCLLARRLVERGVRFVQVFPQSYGVWDSHRTLKKLHAERCGEVDRPVAGLLQDLKRRGLLSETIVVFCTEFGRTPSIEERGGGKDGRDHHPHGFTVWLYGAGIKHGIIHGATDELGFHAVEHPHYVTDIHATVLNRLGLDSSKLAIPGRKRLEIDHGKVIEPICT